MTTRISSTILLVLLAPGLTVVAAAERVAYHDGSELRGRVLEIDAAGVRVVPEAGPEGARGVLSVALYEIAALEFGTTAAPTAPPASIEDLTGPGVCFREGQLLGGRVVRIQTGSAGGGTQIAHVEVDGIGPLEVPLELLRGFRLDGSHARDGRFRVDLSAAVRAPTLATAGVAREDWVYVRRGRQLLRVGGVLRSLDDSFLSMEYEGEIRRIPRARVFAAILAPVATSEVETGYPAVVRLASGGELPAFLAGMATAAKARSLLIRFRGAAPEARQVVPLEHVQLVRFSSDRVAFLSDLAPVRVREVPLVGSTTPFPWRRDHATTGRVLQLGEKIYRKGLGVHAFSSLEFDVGGRFSSFASTIGLVERADPVRDALAARRREEGAIFRVVADDELLFERRVRRSAAPESILLSITNVRRLRLEVDFGKEGIAFGEHAAWAEARVIKQ